MTYFGQISTTPDDDQNLNAYMIDKACELVVRNAKFYTTAMIARVKCIEGQLLVDSNSKATRATGLHVI